MKKYRASDGWKPKITFGNSWKEYLVVIILFKPIAWVLSFIVGLIYGYNVGSERININDITIIDNASALVVVIVLILVANHFIYKKLVKQHEEGISNRKRSE